MVEQNDAMTEPRPPCVSHGKEVVIVTGSSGLLGSAVIRALADEYQVVGFDRDGEPQPPPPVECVCVDLTDRDSVELGAERVRHAYGRRVASVVHLAAYYDFSGEPSPLYDEVTVRGTERLLEAFKRRLEVEQLLFSSTMLVHAPTVPGQPIDERAPLRPSWDYPRSKVATENVIRDARGEMSALLLRVAGVYTDVCDSIPISQQIRRILERRVTSRFFPGDTSHGQAFVHLDDVIDAIRRAIARRRELPEVIAMLIAESETYSYQLLQSELARLLHGDEDWQTHEIPKAIAKSGAWLKDKIPGAEEAFIKPWMIDLADEHYEIDIARARELLGWEPKHRLINTLPRMVESLRADPEAWYARHGFKAPPKLAPAERD